MQFTVNQKDIATALNNIIGATGKNFDNVKIELKSCDRLILTCAKSYLTMSQVIDCVGGQGEPIYINAKDLLARVNLLNDKIEFNDGTLKSGKSKFVLRLAESKYFMAATKVEGEEININSKYFVENLKTALYSSDRKDLRNIISGININANKIASTDGNRIAVRTIDTNLANTTIPLYLANEICKCYTDSDLTIFIDKSKIKLSDGQLTITSALLEGQYPNYNQLIPKDLPNKVIFDKIELLQALQIIAISANIKVNLCKFKFSANNLNIETNNGDGNEATVDIEIENDIDTTIGFNIIYLIEAIKNTPSQVITLEFDKPLQAVVIKGDDNCINIVMPVQLRN